MSETTSLEARIKDYDKKIQKELNSIKRMLKIS
jgi:hypothetical protein